MQTYPIFKYLIPLALCVGHAHAETPVAEEDDAPSGHQLEMSAGFMRGEWKADGVVRGLQGLEAGAGWRFGAWRAGLAVRMLTSIREDAGECEDNCFPARADDERHDPMGALTGGWWGEWWGGQIGVAVLGRDTDDTHLEIKVRPALTFRGGPEILHVSGSLWEPSPTIPAPGRTRVGVGTELGRFQAWLGAATDETEQIGVALGVRAALSERLSLTAGTAISPNPSEFLLIRAGLTFVLGGDPPWPVDP